MFQDTLEARRKDANQASAQIRNERFKRGSDDGRCHQELCGSFCAELPDRPAMSQIFRSPHFAGKGIGIGIGIFNDDEENYNNQNKSLGQHTTELRCVTPLKLAVTRRAPQ